MISSDALLFVRDDHRLALRAHQDLVLGQLEIRHGDNFFVIAGRIQRRLIHKIGKVSTGEAGSTARDNADVDVFAERNFASVNFQDAFAATYVRTGYDDPTIKSPGTKQCGIQNIRTVGRSD